MWSPFGSYFATRGDAKGLMLDFKHGWQVGGDSGPALIPFQPDKSILIDAVRYKDTDTQMPPKHPQMPHKHIPKHLPNIPPKHIKHTNKTICFKSVFRVRCSSVLSPETPRLAGYAHARLRVSLGQETFTGSAPGLVATEHCKER